MFNAQTILKKKSRDGHQTLLHEFSIACENDLNLVGLELAKSKK